MAEVDRDDRSDVLADQLRRNVIRCLQEADVPLSLADLAVALARRSTDDSANVWSRAQRYWIRLTRTDIPTLEEIGLVTYDETRRTVSLSPTADERAIDRVTIQGQ